MIIKPFEYYIKENLVRKTIPNKSMAKALVQKSIIRLDRINKNKIEKEESSIVFEEIYESIRETAQALMELRGYKPYSYEALIAFLKEQNYLSEGIITTLDHYRILRNNSVYQAEKISLEKCQEAKEFANQVIPKLKEKVEELTIKK